MKKILAVLLTLALAAGMCAAMAEGYPLPAYEYPYAEEDPLMAAIVTYMQETDFGFEPEENGVMIPTPIVLKTEMNEDESEAKVWGNFWIFAYKQEGTVLVETSGGECPGIMKLEKKEEAWTVTSFEQAGEGDDYYADLDRFADGDEELRSQFDATRGTDENSVLPQFQRATVVEYVSANDLGIEAYQAPGWDPVRVDD